MSFIKYLIVLTLLAILMVSCGPTTPGDTDSTGTKTTTENSSTTVPTTTQEVPTTSLSTETTDGSMSMGESGLSSSESSETTMDSSSSESTGANEACQIDPTAPGCPICKVKGEPQRLFGLTWNFAGPMGSREGKQELRCINPETGESELIAAIPGLDWLAGKNAYDAKNHTLYVRGWSNDEVGEVERLFSIDTLTGNVLANPAMQMNTQWEGLHVNSNGDLMVLVKEKPEEWEFHKVIPSTGEEINQWTLDEFANGFQAFAHDPEAPQLFLVGQKQGENIDRLFIIDTFAGSLVGNAAFAENLPWTGGLHWRSDKQLVGLTSDDFVGKLFKIDSSAQTQLILPLSLSNLLGINAYDPVNDHIFAIDDMIPNTPRLLKVDAIAADVLTHPELAKPPTPDTNYNWSGGIYVH